MVVMAWPLPFAAVMRISRFRSPPSYAGAKQFGIMAATTITEETPCASLAARACTVFLALAMRGAGRNHGSAGLSEPADTPDRAYGAGGASDVMARYLGQKLGEVARPDRGGREPGRCAGTAAYIAVAKAQPDGYTLGYATSSLAINAVLKPKLGYDPIREFTPVSNFVEVQNVLVVPASSPAKTVADLVAMAKQNPGELNYVSLGPGSTPHLSAELFLAAAGHRRRSRCPTSRPPRPTPT